MSNPTLPAPNRLTEILDESLTQQNMEELDSVELALAYRKKLIERIDAVDALMIRWSDKMREAIQGPVEEGDEPEPQTAVRTYTHSGQPRSHNRLRGGKPTNTSKIVDILLKQPKHTMKTVLLLAECKKQKIPNPESPLYSLRQSGRIRRTLGPMGEVEYLGDPVTPK